MLPKSDDDPLQELKGLWKQFGIGIRNQAPVTELGTDAGVILDLSYSFCRRDSKQNRKPNR